MLTIAGGIVLAVILLALLPVAIAVVFGVLGGVFEGISGASDRLSSYTRSVSTWWSALRLGWRWTLAVFALAVFESPWLYLFLTAEPSPLAPNERYAFLFIGLLVPLAASILWAIDRTRARDRSQKNAPPNERPDTPTSNAPGRRPL